MLLTDINNIFIWWFMVLILGVTSYPLTSLVFKSFFDRGYIFSKIISIAIISFLIFVFGAIKLLNFTSFNIILILLLFVVINYFLLSKKKELTSSLRNNWKIYLFEELMFLSVFCFWSYIKIFKPEINGLEKFMDFGIINSILRTDYFPAKDIWLTPLAINYYYFGHLTTAVLTKLSGISSSITFNLMQALVFALCFTASFSIGANLYYFFKKKSCECIKIITSGILTALLVTVSGNLHILYSFFKPYSNENPIPLWELAFSPSTFPNAYWYPNATRFIYNTIHEFPMYSWVVSDLHGHVLDIPFVLLTIAFLITIFVSKKISFIKIIFLSFLTSILYMTNAWDGVIYIGLSIILISYLILSANKTKEEYKSKFLKMVFYLLSLLFGFFIFSLPLNLFFKPFTTGVGILCAPEFLIRKGQIGFLLFEGDHCQKSPLWQLTILYGFFYLWITLFIAKLVKNLRSKTSSLLEIDKLIFIFIAFSTALILIPEFIYVKDIYPAHYRANTMFKLTYQAFILLSICSAYIIIKLLSFFKKPQNKFSKATKLIIFPLFLLLISLMLLYSNLSVNSYYQELKTKQDLNGTKYLQIDYPNDYKAILWLNKNINKQPVILEAQGDSYTDYARVSSNTGLPTVIGWTVHEWLWRGSYDILALRIKDVSLLYESDDLMLTKSLIEKYNIFLVFIGSLEREKYKNLNEDKFNNLGKIIYQNSSTKIYRLY